MTSVEDRVRQALGEVVATWEGRNAANPVIELRIVPIKETGTVEPSVLKLQHLSESMRRHERVVLEAPAGSGKTTVLHALVSEHFVEFFIADPRERRVHHQDQSRCDRD